MEEITVLLTDDHAIVRQGVRAFLETQPDIKVIGEAGSGEEAIPLCELLAPDIVLMDLLMPGMGGVEATRRLSEGCDMGPRGDGEGRGRWERRGEVRLFANSD